MGLGDSPAGAQVTAYRFRARLTHAQVGCPNCCWLLNCHQVCDQVRIREGPSALLLSTPAACFLALLQVRSWIAECSQCPCGCIQTPDLRTSSRAKHHAIRAS